LPAQVHKVGRTIRIKLMVAHADDQLDQDAGSAQASEIRSVRPTEDCITEGQAMQTCGNRTRVCVICWGVVVFCRSPAPPGARLLGAVRIS
jgi:hypothetical protein